jgi:hypothetical protein
MIDRIFGFLRDLLDPFCSHGSYEVSGADLIEAFKRARETKNGAGTH